MDNQTNGNNGGTCNNNCNYANCKCSHHSVLPALAILIGLDFLLGAFGILSGQAVGIIWPIILILAAGKMLMSRKCKCC